MTTPESTLALGRAMFAVAWADNHLGDQELRVIHDYLHRMPGYNEAMWERMMGLARRPVGESRRVVFLEELRNHIHNNGDLRLVQQAFNQVIAADGVFSEEERACLTQIRRILHGDNDAVWNEMARVIRQHAC